jgi:parallel beta-helix repeat protein
MKSILMSVVLLLLFLPFFAQKKSISVNDFGAVANDKEKDNYTAFVSALDFASKKTIPIINIPTGVFYISKGFLLNDNTKIIGAGIDKTILRLIDSPPPRTDEASQTAIFTGKNAFSLSHTAATKNITIKSLTIDLQRHTKEYDIKKFSILGGIRLINPVECVIDSVKIIDAPKFGIGLHASQAGMSCSYNTVKNCIVIMEPAWYLQIQPEVIPRQETCIGIEVSSFCGDNNNGAAIYLDRKNPDYFFSKTKKNTIIKNSISGGSHGISVSNGCRNILSYNRISDCSHRGIIIISCADSNYIFRNSISRSGSTGIHLAYGCQYNRIEANTIDNVLGVEGDGIKSYINCNYTKIIGNKITGFAKTGIRVAHGANNNIMESNIITGNNKEEQIGIKIIPNLKKLYNEGFIFNNKLTANNNTCSNNNIAKVKTGILIVDEVNSQNNAGNSLQKNKISNNSFKGVREKYKVQPFLNL